MAKKNLGKMIKPFIAKREPEILITMGVSGLIFATIWGVRSTVKAVRKIDILKEETNRSKIPKKEVMKEVWKLYLPVVVATAVSVPCIIASSNVYSKRNMALAAAYTLSETALTEYKAKTKELIGEKKEKEITELVSKEHVAKATNTSNVLLTGNGDSLFYDPASGRYFRSSWNKILKAANEINARAITDPFGVTTLSDWYYSIGLDSTDISDTMGWKVLDGSAGLIDISLNSALTPDDEPCGAIYYNSHPKVL